MSVTYRSPSDLRHGGPYSRSAEGQHEGSSPLKLQIQLMQWGGDWLVFSATYSGKAGSHRHGFSYMTICSAPEVGMLLSPEWPHGELLHLRANGEQGVIAMEVCTDWTVKCCLCQVAQHKGCQLDKASIDIPT